MAVCFTWVLLIGTVLVLLIVITVQGNDNVTDDGIFKAIHLISAICVMICFVITNFYPLNQTFIRGAQSLRETSSLEIQKALGADSSILSTLGSTLADSKCRDVFKEFVIREFNSKNFIISLVHSYWSLDPHYHSLFICASSGENLLYWLEIENYKKLSPSDGAVLKDRADNIYDLYIDDDADRKINVSNTQSNIVKDKIDRGIISIDMFNETQTEIFNLMEKDSFPRFKKSKLCEDLKKSLESAGKLAQTLKAENML
jgi:hypothetical protein